MGVYYALRTHYNQPSGIVLQQFPEDDTVLGWFQRRWKACGGDEYEDEEDPWEYVEEILDEPPYGFASLFGAIFEHALSPPDSDVELAQILDEHLYVEGDLLVTPHAIQVLTDDDELQMAYFFWDDHFLSANPDKVAFLLHEGWILPESVEPALNDAPDLPQGMKDIPLSGDGEGIVFCLFSTFYDSANLSDILGAFRITGAKTLAELPARLVATIPDDEWLPELKILRALAATPDGQSSFGALLASAGRPEIAAIDYANLGDEDFAQSDATTARFSLENKVAKLKPEYVALCGSGSLVQAGEHVAQLCLHSSTWVHPDQEQLRLFARWIFFDDIWLRANPALGKAILRFGTRWDVLT